MGDASGRGLYGAPVDEDGLALTLVKIAQLAADLPQVRGLDINPLIADENGLLAGPFELCFDRRDRNPGIESKQAVLIGDKRIDIEAANLWQISGELGDFY
jgi:hypothetical protein